MHPAEGLGYRLEQGSVAHVRRLELLGRAILQTDVHVVVGVATLDGAIRERRVAQGVQAEAAPVVEVAVADSIGQGLVPHAHELGDAAHVEEPSGNVSEVGLGERAQALFQRHLDGVRHSAPI